MFKNIKRVMFWFITVTCIGGIAFAIINISSHTWVNLPNGYQNTRSPKIGDTKDACIEVIFTKDGWIPKEEYEELRAKERQEGK